MKADQEFDLRLDSPFRPIHYAMCEFWPELLRIFTLPYVLRPDVLYPGCFGDPGCFVAGHFIAKHFVDQMFFGLTLCG